MNLRWIERDGKMVLQEKFEHDKTVGGFGDAWHDVPTAQPEPPKKSAREEVVASLAYVLRGSTTYGVLDSQTVARAALEYLEWRMPIRHMVDQNTPGYNQAISDVRKQLFGTDK